jgi:hypothetical protein
MRIAYSKHISDLFTIGLSLKDILKWCEEEKNLIRSADPEKYEKLYSMILEKERIAKHTADPIKQHIALCTVYVLSDQERVDYFDDAMAEEKMNLWNADTSMIAFFLSWHNQHIQHYTKTLEGITRTASSLEKMRAQL